ncbi:hypothetical protein K503DRAFT_772904 [Rhizopogon vinicolor AM-OR11-026]|uniref:Uncharacterized protein n=1 Tax=Rhizopogon vinicolor AM-OR11-026 TaxID=1314800 RepID=A0A1B7MTV4_9AGAM|nr:hypothetical protein K503DRAFT_772904 [Rhizopogon vinicolor AM-OR11-026]
MSRDIGPFCKSPWSTLLSIFGCAVPSHKYFESVVGALISHSSYYWTVLSGEPATDERRARGNEIYNECM